MIDLNVAWKRIAGSNFDAALHVTNLTDKVYTQGIAGVLLFGIDSKIYGAPRMVSFDLSMKL